MLENQTKGKDKRLKNSDMNQNYYTNNPYSMGANQNFPPLSQSGSGGYPDAAMGNMGMMKQNQMNIGKLNDPMGFAGPSCNALLINFKYLYSISNDRGKP